MLRPRGYQKEIAESALSANTLVVLPTGLGKTEIAFLVAKKRLALYKAGKAVVLAPTKPLADQHARSLRGFPGVTHDGSFVLTGEVDPDQRSRHWNRARFVFATPETVLNDARDGRIDFFDVVLLIFDEAHRSIGDYSYAKIARIYRSQASAPLILALTASPGSTRERIEQIKKNLLIEKVEARTEADAAVKRYVQPTSIETIEVALPKEYRSLSGTLKSILKEKVSGLAEAGFLAGQSPTMTALLRARGPMAARLKASVGATRRELVRLLEDQAQAVAILHGIEVLETQGMEVFLMYLQRQKASPRPAISVMLKDSRWLEVEKSAKSSASVGSPKLERLIRVVKEQLAAKTDSKIIVFTQYRDTVETIVKRLNASNVTAVRLLGQKKRAGVEGITQRQQTEVLQSFGSGRFKVLVSSSIGEEGIHVPDVDLVVFMEAVPSEIRSIQRRGRTGRTRPGKVVVLLAKGTVDEAHYRGSLEREESMRKLVAPSEPDQGWHRDLLPLDQGGKSRALSSVRERLPR